MHPTRFRLAQHDASLAVETQLLEERAAVFTFGGDFAYSDFVADHFNRLFALHHTAKDT